MRASDNNFLKRGAKLPVPFDSCEKQFKMKSTFASNLHAHLKRLQLRLQVGEAGRTHGGHAGHKDDGGEGGARRGRGERERKEGDQ
jgi:hypothetical protein